METQPLPDITPETPTPDSPTPDWLPERLERARRAALRDFLSDIGYLDAESLKTTLQTGASQIETLTQERDAAIQAASQASTARQSALLEAAFQVNAARYPFIDVTEARALLDTAGVQVTAEGGVIGMEEAVFALVERRPHLLRRVAPPELDSHHPTSAQAGEDLSPERVAEVKRRFRLNW